MEQNTNRLLWAVGLLTLGALLLGGSVLAQENFLPKISQAFVKMIDGPGYSDEEIDDLIKNHDFIPVATADELNNVRNETVETYGVGTKWAGPYTGGYDKKYVQVANIDLSGHSDGEGWMPLGTSYRAEFKGSFNGNGYKITGLTINRPSQESVGLFGYTDGAAISNVALENVNVTGNKQVGGLVGHADQITTISNSYTTGSVTGFIHVGGLVGEAFYGSKISNSYSTGEVSGATAGGLVGRLNYSSEISNSYATGSVTGDVSGGATAGGLVGGAAYDSEISNSYATGSVTGVGGGLVGSVYYNKSISNSYWDTETTGHDTSAGEGEGESEGKSTVDMMKQATYSGWDFDTVWKINEGEYPTLR